MKAVRLPISICHTSCPNCWVLTDFRMFESGPGGDFATYEGALSGTMYRLNVYKTGQSPLAALLAPAISRDGSVRHIPEQIKCKVCGAIFAAKTIGVDHDEMTDSFDL